MFLSKLRLLSAAELIMLPQYQGLLWLLELFLISFFPPTS